MKKTISIMLTMVLALSMFAGCAAEEEMITVISREDGSGTRGAFIELFGIEEKDAQGNKTDKTTEEAIIANKTDVVITNISEDVNAIGYVSIGSLSDDVKALSIDGVKATSENVMSGTYKAFRPFNIAVKNEISEVAQDFIDFILSAEGQEIVSQSYVAVNDSAESYSGSKPQGKVVVAGSSSVTPVMEKLKEAYVTFNPNAEIEIQMSDSTAGVTGAIEGTCDIGMASRSLKDSEKEQLTGIEIAYDGIAVVVNPENVIDDMTSEQVKAIFTGEMTSWNEMAE
ncbi:MAG: substrate-binding domain-containing protein [Clostridia bacterium]|nr:substrate-binding domain-containing protein [Clostridia bacterium]